MASSSSHRSAASVSNNLVPPVTPLNKQQRRMTSPSSLGVPEGARKPQPNRPPSPLRNGFTSTGIDPDDVDSDDDDQTWQRSPSPSSSVSRLASDFAQRMGAFVGNGKKSGSLPTDAELEAEAERERERSRREAERILTREAAERRNVEDRVLAMLQSQRSNQELPPPARAQTLPNPPSPSQSQKEKEKESGTGWWTAAKNRLTPTKEPLTPAQQVVKDTKAREKERRNSKGKDDDKSWPASADKHSDPAFLNLGPPATSVHRPPAPSSPSSPTPARPSLSNMPPNLTPSPMRSFVSEGGVSNSPSREAPPLYAQFNEQGTLDVHGTLLTIARRFEKLEKWTVGHVRALEDRMSDVERWLVDKEKEKETTTQEQAKQKDEDAKRVVSEEVDRMREELAELQSRVAELGREIAKSLAAPKNLSTNSSQQSVQVSMAPATTSLIAEPAVAPPPPVTPAPKEEERMNEFEAILMSPPSGSHHRALAPGPMDSTSPPLSSNRNLSRTRLPYPSGDYAPPPDSGVAGLFSPTSSPPSSLTSNTRNRAVSYSGLPPAGLGMSSSPRTPVITPAPLNPNPNPNPNPNLPPPKPSAPRRESVSPTPRKRYTVALGGPLTAPPSDDEYEAKSLPNLHRPNSSVSTAYFSSSSAGEEDEQEETIGKSAGRKAYSHSHNHSYDNSSVSSQSSDRKIRVQSAYGYSSLQPPQTPITPTRPLRSRSTDKLSQDGGKFVDPLVIRRQEMAQSNNKIAMPRPMGSKVPVGKLVAFFDQDQHK